MGEVYRAIDTRLNRTVAIKFLPAHLSRNSELRQRFEREVRAVSSLNHPHICTLYDIGQDGDVDYFVMEFIEGKTLADRLSRGALPLEQTLQYAIQLADALSAAHRRGIIHRDIKPGNIMLVKSGTKLLDFGLAKLSRPATSGPSTLHSAATLPVNEPRTAAGTILGTIQYMAPEQLEGTDAGARTDIFAFGAVLYEMTSGHKAFDGTSRAGIIASGQCRIARCSRRSGMVTRHAVHYCGGCIGREPRIPSAPLPSTARRWAAGKTHFQRIHESRLVPGWTLPTLLGRRRQYRHSPRGNHTAG
jgi:serine/threonine protein kinase